MTRRERTTIAITGAGLFMVVLDNLIVASTLPAIQRSLGGSLDSLEWVLDAYILAFGVLMLSAAALGERYGRRKMFVIGIALFTVSSAAGAVAPEGTIQSSIVRSARHPPSIVVMRPASIPRVFTR